MFYVQVLILNAESNVTFLFMKTLCSSYRYFLLFCGMSMPNDCLDSWFTHVLVRYLKDHWMFNIHKMVWFSVAPGVWQ